MNHNILKSSIFWNLFFNRESKSQATALWHLLCSYISTSTVLQFVLMHNTFQSIGKYTYFLKQKIIWEVTTEPCSQLFKKLKILACLGAKLGYRTKFQNSLCRSISLDFGENETDGHSAVSRFWLLDEWLLLWVTASERCTFFSSTSAKMN